MKVKKANAGTLTNFEVLEFLKARGAASDSSRVIAPVAASEYKVYDYLVETPASRQTREKINEFMEKCQKYKLAKAEILNITDLVPRQLVELDPIIEQSEMRMGDQVEELLDLVTSVFPGPEVEAGTNDDKEKTGNEKQNEDIIEDGEKNVDEDLMETG